MGKGRFSVMSALLLAHFLLSAAQDQPEEGFLLAKGRAGQVRIGMSVDELYAKVGREHTKLVDLFGEGLFDPALEVYVEGGKSAGPTLVAEIGGPGACHHVWRIAVTDSRFKTTEAIGVGSTLGSIRKSHHVDWIDFGEGSLCARVDEIGMTFELDYWPSHSWTRRAPEKIPDSAKVVSVLVVQ